jgi:hypothetical protein
VIISVVGPDDLGLARLVRDADEAVEVLAELLARGPQPVLGPRG